MMGREPLDPTTDSATTVSTLGARWRSARIRRWGLRVGLCLGIAAILLLSNGAGVVRASLVPPTISVTGMHPETISSGSTATITANISNGIPLSAVNGTFTGYLVFFFYGQTNGTGALGFDKQFVPAPAGCTLRDVVCPDSAPVTFTHTYNRAGSYDTSLTVYDAAGDYTIATSVVNVVPPSLNVTALSNRSTAPEDGPINFSANVTTVPASYESDGFAFEWIFGDNTTAWGNPVSHSYNESGNYVAIVRAFDNSTGAANQTSVTGINITNPPPSAGLSILSLPIAPHTYAEGSSLQFSAAGSSDVPSDAGLLRYFWNFGDGALGSGPSPTHTYSVTGTFVVHLVVTDESGLKSNASSTITITNAGPSPSAATTSIQVGNVALFNASATGDVPVDLPSENYTWSTAVPLVTDMGSSYGVIGRDGYFAPGTYSAQLQAKDSEGLSANTSVPVPVTDAPPNAGVYSMYTLANLTLTLSGSIGNTLQLTVLSSGHVVTSAKLTRTTGAPSGNVLSIPSVPLSLADTDTISIQYAGAPPDPAGSNPATLTVVFWGNSPCPFKTSKSLCAPQSYSNTFNPSGAPNFVWQINGNKASVGQLVFLKAQVFSPARTGLTTTWHFGDGTTAVSSTSAPATAQPTIGTITAQHRWAIPATYTLTLSTVDGAPSSMANSSSVQVVETTAASVSDIAPTVSIVAPATEPAANLNTLGASIASENYGATLFSLYWHFGDSEGATQSVSGFSASETHLFRFSATKYAVVVYAADRVGGPSTVAWQFLTITNGAPLPAFTVSPGPLFELSNVVFNATQSVDFAGGVAGANLSYAWNFGDGSLPAGGSRGAGAVVGHVFTQEGTFPVTLTVTDPEGLSASVTHNVSVTDVPVHATLLNRTVTVDQFSTFNLTGLTGASTDLATLGATWHWGDGSNSTGLQAGHTYLATGVYHLTVTLSSEDSDPLFSLSAYVTVLDQPFSVSLPYGGYAIYGENHTVTFQATVLGSAADSSAGPSAFSYQWSFGDGSSPAVTSGGLTGSVGHVYSAQGNPTLSVFVTGPNGTTGSASAVLNSIPNWDGDGIPDEYAATILHLPPGNDPSHGTGLTDFLSKFVVNGTTPNADTNGDGLTDFQDVFGTVTGYVTSPLDPNVAGDGILNGGHAFSDSFTAPTVVNFTGSGAAQIPGVYHPSFLAAPSIRSIALYAEVVSSDLANLTLNLTDLASGHSGSFANLGGMSSPVENWTLLNSTPVGGPMTNYSVTIPDFQVNSTWQLTVSGGNGTIQSASIVITYYTNPNLADPFAAGLLLGSDLSIPVFNASEPVNANYSVFDGHTFTYSPVYYYPYTEQYYKLSVVQGLPYYPWDNASFNANQNATGPLVSDPHAFATYYGDKEFKIGPWQTHAAGDAALTNGMKAYGRTVYDLTANHYLQSTGVSSYGASFAPPPYPYDTLGYSGPLNPTSFSTGTSGIADSKAINPVAGPEVFGVTINSGWSECVLEGLTLINPAVGQGVISNLDITNSTGAPATMFTGSVAADDHSYNATPACYWWHFTFNAHYQIPVNTSKSTNTIRLGIDFANAADNAFGGAMNFLVSTNPSAGTQNVSGEIGPGCSVFCISGSVTAFQLDRMPAVVVNSSGEVHNLPGYGPHWHGDQHVYSLYLTLNDSGAGTPFHAGTNLVLVSGSAFANSSLNHTLQTKNTTALPFLGGANFTKRSDASDLYILGSLNVTLNSSDALELLAALIPHNGSGNVTGGYLALTQTQFELLGLSGQIMKAAPYLPFPTSFYSASSAAAPTTFFGEILNVLTEVWDAIVSVIVAIGNFLVNLALEIGQAIIGAWNSFVNAVQNAINAIVQAFDFIIAWINAQFEILKTDIQNAMTQLGGQIVAKMVLPMLSLLVNVGVMSETQYNTTYANLSAKYNISDPPTLASGDAKDQIAAILNIVLAVLSAVAVIIGVILYIIGIATVGVGEVTEEAFFATGQLVAFGVQQAVAGGILAGLAALAGIVGAVFSVCASVSDSVLNNLFGSEVGTLLGATVGSVISTISGIGFAVSDAILANTIEGLSGYYIGGAVLGVLGIILASIATVLAALNESYLVQVILFTFALACDVIGGVLPFLPQALAVEEASQTVMMGVGISVFAGAAALATIGGLILAVTDFQKYGSG